MRVRALLVGAVSAAVLAAAVPSAQAITGGQPDGEAHPNVALLLFYAKDASTDAVAFRYRCTGSLVSPTVILTAAHCTEGIEGAVLATFTSEIAQEPPSGLPRAADDIVLDPNTGESTGSVDGFSPDQAGGSFGFVAGTAHVHPQYSGFTDMANWNDVGVVTLTAPVDATPITIAPLGTLDEVAQPALNSTLFTFVGYGTRVDKPASGPQKPVPLSYPLIRRVADAPGQKLTGQILQVNGNFHDNKGDGGTCFGDSGGPGLLGGQQVTVTSYGYTDNCRYIDGHQRLDIPVVQEWLAEFDIPGMAPAGSAPEEGAGPGKGNGKGKAAGAGNGNGGGNGNSGGNGTGAGNGNSGGNGVAAGSGKGLAVGQSNDRGRDDLRAVRAGQSS